ncbi:MAG TPA: histidine phosphatase family protein [Verrucomicrobiae bacterium]|nr:histidine phosphatase family protein [Verrucomicrobiae bacterium]
MNHGTTTIYTLRHARTQYNAERRYAGSLDIPLSPEGVDEARRAAQRVRNLKLDLVVASRLRRSLDTAAILVGQRIPIVQTRLCNERNFGLLEGRTWEQVGQLNPPVMLIRVGNDWHTVNPRNAEPFEDVWARAKRFRNWLFRHHPGRKVLVISHGVFLQMFHGVLRRLTCIESLAHYPANLELASFEFSGKTLVHERVVALNGATPTDW